jgi:hypothetical protein
MRCFSGDKARRQSVARGVGRGDRLVERAHPAHLQQRREQFLVRHGLAGHVDQARRDERLAQAVDRRHGAHGLAGHGLGAGQGLGGRAVGDQGTHESLLAPIPRTDHQPLRQGRHGVDHRPPRRVVRDDQPPGARAALAGGDEGRLHDQGRHGLGVAGVPDHQRVVAAQFEGQDHVGPVGEVAAEESAGGGRAGEQQAVDVLVDQRLADLAAALHQVDDARRHAGLLQGLDQQLARQGRLFRRLEHHGVAGQQGRHDVAVGQVAREVERAQHRHHAMRAMAQHGATERHVAGVLAGALVIGLDRGLDLAGHRAQFGLGLPQRLAGLAAQRLGEGRRAGHQGVLVAAQDRDPLFARQVGPGRKGLAGRRDGRRHVGGTRRGLTPDDLARGRIDRVASEPAPVRQTPSMNTPPLMPSPAPFRRP